MNGQGKGVARRLALSATGVGLAAAMAALEFPAWSLWPVLVVSGAWLIGAVWALVTGQNDL